MKLVNFLSNRKGESYVDTAGKILIAVAIAVILIAGLSALWSSDILPAVKNKVVEIFNKVTPNAGSEYTG